MPARASIPIILLPGMDGTGESLTDLAARLSAQRPVQVVAYPHDRPMGYDELTAFVLERTPNGRFVLLGESFSGPIAIEIAATDPRVAGLILVSSFARHPLPTFLTPLARMLDLRWTPFSLIETALLGPAGTPEVRADLARVLAGLPREILKARACEVLRVDKQNRLRAVTCPMLYLHGRFDRLVRKRHVREITSLQSECKVLTFDAPHMLLQTHPSEVAEAIDRWCQALRIDTIS